MYSTVEYNPVLALKVKTIRKIIDIIPSFPKFVIVRLFFKFLSYISK